MGNEAADTAGMPDHPRLLRYLAENGGEEAGIHGLDEDSTDPGVLSEASAVLTWCAEHPEPEMDFLPHPEYELAQRHLLRELSALRITALREVGPRPRPYTHEALADLSVRRDGLVTADSFEWIDGAPSRRGYVFQVLPSTSSPNSMYWAIPHLLECKKRGAQVFFRLDPYRCVPLESYWRVVYKMQRYGMPLNWDRIDAIREMDHTIFYPDHPVPSNVKTDLVWDPRGTDEIHFSCEQLPSSDVISYAGAPYLHSIYHRTKDFSHVDGAVRIYDRQELATRSTAHVRNAGKMGLRTKIFLAVGSIPREVWCDIVVSFFVWNEDVHAYFGLGTGGRRAR